MKVKIKKNNNLKMPEYATEGASCMDICMDFRLTANDSKNQGTIIFDYDKKTVTLLPGSILLGRTGINVAIPEGYEIQVRGRSGLAINHGIGIVNGIGTIDSDYRGDIGVILINNGFENFTIKDGDRVAQIALVPVTKIVWEVVDELNETIRGRGGYGSTGVGNC